ncbi:hypothetical protein [Dyadobacter sp. CY323]|uniref:hypothetical protein n=1 Tax=Dyadobacter sp. CY323 TaxID=2907302 RepID=UPI001F2936E6|nr:hypothetical protein [Dyadobacter sp. CY323]MCE6993124.1 hypothetical protein [Dyadobacter sp. CY323]
MKVDDPETSIRMRCLTSVKKRLEDKKAQSGFKSLTEYLLFMGLGDPPRRKAPTPERVALIKALSNLGHILTELKARPEDTSAIEAQVTFMANKIHEEFGYDS